jgi:hypothetical protein
MIVFYFNLGGTVIPISLSPVGRKYVKSVWKENHYNGYKISHNYILGDILTTITPKGLKDFAKIGLVLQSYFALYKEAERNAWCLESTELKYDRITT